MVLLFLLIDPFWADVMIITSCTALAKYIKQQQQQQKTLQTLPSPRKSDKMN